ncbi:MAG: hypothetical protein PHT19_13285 [Methylococcus sp.]|nr:hypothetical protein [Methylococcus sp.]
MAFDSNAANLGTGYYAGNGKGGAIFVCTSDLGSSASTCSGSIDEAASCGNTFTGNSVSTATPVDTSNLFWTGASGGQGSTSGLTDACATPTPVPTASPTPVPTASPTPVPTASPTPVPTASPTPVPTASPTPVPTASPTPAPTASPTPAPTASPTPAPTASPTPAPTATPGPTASPTPAPTATPSPTLAPVPGFYGLRVSVSGDGSASGMIVSAPVGIDCGTVCEDQFRQGSAVYLTAVPKAGSVFAGWMNCDIIQKDQRCMMSMTGPKPEVVARFRLATEATPAPGATATPAPVPTAAPTPLPTLAPTPAPTPVPTGPQAVLNVTTLGQGTVSSEVAGIDCGPVCSASFDVGSAVTLTAMPAEGYKFKRWIGAGCGPAGKKPCTVTLNKSKTVKAKFVKKK